MYIPSKIGTLDVKYQFPSWSFSHTPSNLLFRFQLFIIHLNSLLDIHQKLGKIIIYWGFWEHYYYYYMHRIKLTGPRKLFSRHYQITNNLSELYAHETDIVCCRAYYDCTRLSIKNEVNYLELKREKWMSKHLSICLRTIWHLFMWCKIVLFRKIKSNFFFF